MKHATRLAIAFAMALAGLATIQPQQARATTMIATICTVALNPCPAGKILDGGIRTNGVGLLGANRYALLPFTFVDASASVTGTVVVADFAAKFIYLVGFGTANSDVGPVDIDIAISQNYLTTPGGWFFKGFNIGACNGAATGAGDGVTSLPYVNGVPLGGAVDSLCSPFAQFFGPKLQAVGPITNLTAAAIFGFNGGKGQSIGLPWGDDFPTPDLDIGPTTTLPDLVNTLKTDGLQLEVPEPSTWAILIVGFGVIGFMMRPRRRPAARAAA
jgi:hypothetical protein